MAKNVAIYSWNAAIMTAWWGGNSILNRLILHTTAPYMQTHISLTNEEQTQFSCSLFYQNVDDRVPCWFVQCLTLLLVASGFTEWYVERRKREWLFSLVNDLGIWISVECVLDLTKQKKNKNVENIDTSAFHAAEWNCLRGIFGRIYLLDRLCACGAIERNCVDRTHANRSIRMISPLWPDENASSI